MFATVGLASVRRVRTRLPAYLSRTRSGVRRISTGELLKLGFRGRPVDSLKCRSSSKARRGYRVGQSELTRGHLPGYVTDFLAASDGLELTKAFLRIKKAALRRRIVHLVEQITAHRDR